MKRYIFFLSLVIVIFLGCNRSSSSSNKLSSDPTITSMRFAKSDSFPHLSEAQFTIVNKFKGDTGLIYNIDSITYGCKINAVVPVFGYSATPYALQFHVASDTVDTFFYFKTGDTIDFTRQPIYLNVTSQDRSTTKTYQIKPVVHTADPDLFNWLQLSDAVVPFEAYRQNVLQLEDTYYYLATDGVQKVVYQSDDLLLWQNVDCSLTVDIDDYIAADDKILCIEPNRVLYSTDWKTWNTFADDLPAQYVFDVILCWYDDLLLTLVYDSSNQQRSIAIVDENEISLLDPVPVNFPVEGFGAVTFNSVAGRKRAMLVGGYNAKGEMLNSRWNIEKGAETYKFVNFSDDKRNPYDPIAGVALAYYNGKIYSFGGINESNELLPDFISISDDEGMSWTPADTAHNKMPDGFIPRYNMSVITTDDAAVLLFGGRSKQTTFSDAYIGVLNELLWSLNK